MLKYFDKTFFKFLFGFVSILVLSFFIIFLTRAYTPSEMTAAPVIDSVSEVSSQ